jgi:pSer/pThr/pTyr-binding forkhead associated (FHA) protein
MAKIIISQQGMPPREVVIDKDRMTIGRSGQNDVVIAHRAVSGRHAVIENVGNDCFLEDLGSTNGTLVNGRHVTRHFLQHNDVIGLPDTLIEFVAEQDVSHAMAETIEARPAPVEPSGPPAVIKVLTGANAGKQLSLTKALTTIGKPGVQVAVVQRQGAQYYLTHVEGPVMPTVNGKPIGHAPYLLGEGDQLELSGTQMLFAY